MGAAGELAVGKASACQLAVGGAGQLFGQGEAYLTSQLLALACGQVNSVKIKNHLPMVHNEIMYTK